MEKKPPLKVDIEVDTKGIDSAIEKSDRLLESLREADRLIREINEIEPDKIFSTSTGKDKQ